MGIIIIIIIIINYRNSANGGYDDGDGDNPNELRGAI
jgi:hypothetical protein